MSRTQSQGLEFFPMDTDFFSDKKIQILKGRYGVKGLSILLYLLCSIYREGYYMKWDEDCSYVISDELHVSSDIVAQVLTFLLERSMFNKQLFQSDAVLTSAGIQERWQKAVAARATKTPIEVCSRFWLLSENETRPFIKCSIFNGLCEKNDDNSEKNDDNSENYSQSKVKESKVNITTTTTETRTHACESENWSPGTATNVLAPSSAEVFVYFKRDLCSDDAVNQADKFWNYNNNRKWDCISNNRGGWKAAADLWISRQCERH